MTELKAKSRTELGKKTNSLRRAGFLPAVVYGEGMPSRPVTVSHKDFEKVYREAGESTIVKLEIDGTAYNVLIYDTENDPLSGRLIHADFYTVRMDKEIRTKVPVEFVGESPAVKNDGGILVKVMQEVEIEVLPQDLPHSLKINISPLIKFEDRILVRDLLLPKGVKVIAGNEEVMALVEPPRSEEEFTKVEEVAPVEKVQTEREAKAEAQKAEEETEEV